MTLRWTLPLVWPVLATAVLGDVAGSLRARGARSELRARASNASYVAAPSVDAPSSSPP